MTRTRRTLLAVALLAVLLLACVDPPTTTPAGKAAAATATARAVKAYGHAQLTAEARGEGATAEARYSATRTPQGE